MAMVPRWFFRPFFASFWIAGLPVLLFAHASGEAAALDHEAVDDAMKDGAVVMAFLGVFQEILTVPGALSGFSSRTILPQRWSSFRRSVPPGQGQRQASPAASNRDFFQHQALPS
jgi:hypothetical protein